MIRRFGAALIGLALTLPLVVMPVAAHTDAGLVVSYSTYTVGGDTHIVGTVANHTANRRANVVVTATFLNGTTVVATQAGAAYITNLAPHATTPFHLVEIQDVTTATSTTVTAAGTATSNVPAGGLEILTTTLTGGNIKNESGGAATNVVVYGTRRSSGVITDTTASAVIPTIAAGATVAYTWTFAGSGTEFTSVAQSTSGTYLTSWDNYFSDLGGSNFSAEIAYMANRGITLGCGPAIYCPKSSVTREQMAIFLDRAFVFTDDTDGTPFTDIGGRTAEAQQAIANLHNEGITGGCTATTYCPTASVTRGQMAKFIALAWSLPPAVSDHFTDDTGHFSEPYNNQMFEAGITLGCGATTYCPNLNVTREQMAAFIYRAET